MAAAVTTTRHDPSPADSAALQLESDLRQFTGTENYHKHWSGRIMHTDGVEYLAEKAGAYWLIDLIASHQRKRVAALPFQAWELKVDRTRTPMAVAECREDNGLPAVVRQKIEYTDFPLGGIKLFLCDGVLMLPSEY